MRVQNNTLFIHKGDTGKIEIKIKLPNGDPFPYTDISNIYFTVKYEDGSDIEKAHDNGTGDIELTGGAEEDTIATIWFNHEDTSAMPIGRYRYDVQINYIKNGKSSIFTLIPPSDFIIEKVITLKPFS